MIRPFFFLLFFFFEGGAGGQLGWRGGVRGKG